MCEENFYSKIKKKKKKEQQNILPKSSPFKIDLFRVQEKETKIKNK